MSGSDILEFIQKFWLQFFLTGIGGFCTWLCKNQYDNMKKARKEEEERIEKEKREAAEHEQEQQAKIALVEAGVLALLHDRLLQVLVHSLQVGEITSDEMDNITSMYTAYHDLGGNGTIKTLYERFEAHVKITVPDYLS